MVTPDDPTFMRNQPALRGAKGVWWLLPAGVLGAVAIVLLALSIPIAPVVAWIGIVLEITLFAAMCVSVVTLPIGKQRSIVFASLMGAMAAVALIAMLVILAVSRAQAAGVM